MTISRAAASPAMALAIVYFGYIARMMRAGTIQAMDSDYVRTASMKGLSSSQVMRKHVLRNAIAPTITVMSIQIGYLVSGIVAVEVVFNYPGFRNERGVDRPGALGARRSSGAISASGRSNPPIQRRGLRAQRNCSLPPLGTSLCSGCRPRRTRRRRPTWSARRW